MLKQHNGGFEIIDLNTHNKTILIRLTGSCSGCVENNGKLKNIISEQVKKILFNYKINFYK